MTTKEYGPFTVDEFVTESDFKMVNFDPKNLDDAFHSNPGTIAYFGHMLGRAKRQSANFKTRRDAVKAKVSRRIRDELTVNGKQPAAATVDTEMRTDREFLQVSYAENHAIEVEQTIEALYWAARGRRNDMEFFAQKERNEGALKGFRRE
jgi:hypothetical protein